MLSSFRSGVGQILVAAIAFAIIIVFALEFRTGRNSTTADMQRECAVAFDGYCVDSKEYFAAYGLIAPPRLEPKQARQLALRKKVLDGLVERELLVAAAKKSGLEVNENSLDDDLAEGRVRASLPADIAPDWAYRLGLCPAGPQGYGCAPGAAYPVRQLQVGRAPGDPFDYKLYERQVRMITNRGPKEFKEMQERELVASRMRELVRSRVRIPDTEAFLLYQRDREKIVVRTVELRRDWFAKHAISTDDAAVQRYALAHQAEIDAEIEAKKDDFTAGCMLASEILIELPNGVVDDEKAPIKAQAQAARDRVSKGEAFAAVARAVSNGDAALVGGDLGCLGKSYGVGADELLKAAEGGKAGDLTQVIESPRGYHVLSLRGKLDPAKLKDVTRSLLAERLYVRFAADEAVASFANQLILRVQGGEKLENASQALAASFLAASTAHDTKAENPALALADAPKFEVSAPFNVSGNPLPDVAANESLSAPAFELSQPDAVVTRPLPTVSGAVVMQLKERTPVSREEFLKEKVAVVSSLSAAKSAEALARYVGDLKKAAGEKLVVLASFGEESKPQTPSEEE